MPKVDATIKNIAPGLDAVQTAFKEKLTQSPNIYTSPEQLEQHLIAYETALESMIGDAYAAMAPHIGWLRWREVLLAFKAYCTQHMTSIPKQLFDTHMPPGYKNIVNNDVPITFTINMLHSFSINYLADFGSTANCQETTYYVTPELVTDIDTYPSLIHLAIQHELLHEVLNKHAVKKAVNTLIIEWIKHHIVTFANSHPPTLIAIDYENDIFIGSYELDKETLPHNMTPRFAFKPIKFTKTPKP